MSHARRHVVTLKIDGKDVQRPRRRDDPDVARENGIDIPTLCHLDGLTDIGACRLCLVEIKGVAQAPARLRHAGDRGHGGAHQHRAAAARTAADPGAALLRAATTSARCACRNGHCELQDMAQKLGMTHVSLPYRYPKLQVDASHDLFRAG